MHSLQSSSHCVHPRSPTTTAALCLARSRRPPPVKKAEIADGYLRIDPQILAGSNAAMGLSSMPAPKESLLIYLLYNAVVSIAALASLLRAALVFLGLPAPPPLLLSGEDGEWDHQPVVSPAGPSLAESFRSRFRPARFGRRRGAAATAAAAAAAPDCRVCLVRFEPEAVVNRLPCGHLFHRACLETWLDYDHATCPLCRSCLLPAADESRSSQPALSSAWI